VNGPTRRVRRQATVARGFMEQMRAVTRDAAKQNDAGTLGMDGWIQTMHKMIDVGVRTYAALLETAVAGPWWTEASPGEPPTSEKIEVQSQPYPRKFTIVEPFARVGLPWVKIPNDVIRFEPEILPRGAEEFKIGLKDYDFCGANYTGTIRLSPAWSSGPPEAPRTLTVGL
jgi:hypothetical protein